MTASSRVPDRLLRGAAEIGAAARRGVALAAGLLAVAPGAAAQSSDSEPAARVERVQVQGNRFLQAETLLYYVHTRPGDAYDVQRLREDFRRLWDTGFLDDLRVDANDGHEGKIVTFSVAERKRIQIVDYSGSKELTTTNIEDELKKREAQIGLDTFYDVAKSRRVKSIIEEMLARKGRPFGSVKYDAKSVGGAGQQLSFVITDGPKAKIEKITFDGNTAFSDSQLRGKLKNLKQPGLLSWIGGKTTYTELKWAGGDERDPHGDRGRLEDFYLNHGYVTARIGQPRISYADGEPNEKKPTKHVTIEIPVTEGAQYRMGELQFEGLTVLKEPFVRQYFRMEAGDVYDDSKFKKAFEKLRDVYGSLGYFQWTGATQRKPDPERNVVDVTVRMEEDKQYFLGRITFTGNDQTRDKVIRREVYMNEGDVFDTEALKASIKRINQLGYFKPMEGAPEIKPSESGEDKVDVTFKVEEQNRNQFTFGGGYSGYEGAFLNASFSTSNFLGAGETVSLAAQAGGRTKNYSLSISEPYFLDRAITAAFNVFFNRITYLSYGTYVGYGQQTQGTSLTSGISVGRFSRLFTSYSFQIIDLYDVDTSQLPQGGQDTSDGSGSAAPSFDASAFGGFGRRFESTITPSWSRNTVNNPYMPRSGMRITADVGFAGGPLGGTVDYYRPHGEFVYYHPIGRRMALGLRTDMGYIRAYGGTAEIPYYQRYFLGGETQLRGYNVRSVAPYDPESHVSIGGNKYMLYNAEYYVDVVGPFRLLAFFDAGQAFAPGQGFWWRTMTTCTGAELRFTMPVLNVPFRLIYAFNLNRDFYQPPRAFKFAVGTTF